MITSTSIRNAWPSLFTFTLVPIMGGLLAAAGWFLLRTGGPNTRISADTALAMGAAIIGLILCAWWAGGITMAVVSRLAAAGGWARTSHIAARLTPSLIARAGVALVGLHILSTSPAMAADTAASPPRLATAGEVAQAASGAIELTAAHSLGVSPPVANTPQTDATLSPFWGSPAHSDPGNLVQEESPTVLADAGAATPSDTQHPASDCVVKRQSVTSPLATDRVCDGTLTVISGDTLWDLTSQLLGPNASPHEIAQGVHLWTQINRLPQGPDLITPGDVLSVPTALTTTQ